MIKEIVTHPDDRLREKSKDVSLGEITTEKFSQLVKDMTETMKKKDGIGLAAPQIGVGKRVAVINSKN
ncbi:peptide deformylase, partial [Candidatus Falkowbacteria bacterium]|nr:peptide deformylase [Candidatus Falkowbacteria bacterium]